jgi:hypothetical protein
MLSAPPHWTGLGAWSPKKGPRIALRSPLSPLRREREQRLVLPYLGGAFVQGLARRYQLVGRIEPGWYLFRVTGAEARALEPTPPEGLERLSWVRGYLVGPWFFGGRVRSRLALMPPEQALDLTPCVARKLPGGAWIFGSFELLDEQEARAQEALDEGQPCPARGQALREAYGFALLWQLCRRLGVPATPWGLRGQLAQVASEGKQGAFDLLAPSASMAPLHGVSEVPPGGADEALLEPVLTAAGARLLGARAVGEELLEVRFRFLERPFVCLVERASLRVVDAGLCLDGCDGRLSLACLPAVLREGVAGGKIVVTRRAPVEES